jgi:phosphatidylserine synthase
LSLKFPKYKHHDLNTIMFYVNGLTVIIYALCFTVLPLSDFRENMMKLQTNYTGFIFHYISLAAAIFLSIRIYRAKKQEGPVVMSNPLLFTCLLVAVITFVCSLELILHIAHLRVGHVGALTAVEEYKTSDEYNTMQRHVIKAGFPILWGLLSFAFLFYGMKKHYQTFRVAALLLIGITVLKLFIYDIRSTSEGGKILAFIILGVVLLIISFMYQKIKALIIEGRPGNENPPAS